MSDIKYLIHPGYVKSKSDGDIHYINGQTLIRLYKVNPTECLIEKDDEMWTRGFTNEFLNNLKPLFPDPSGKYRTPTDKTKEENI